MIDQINKLTIYRTVRDKFEDISLSSYDIWEYFKLQRQDGDNKQYGQQSVDEIAGLLVVGDR